MSSDILDVLNIQGRDNAPPKKKQKTDSSQPKTKGPTGINRELYQLLGQNTPPVAVRNQQKFKDRLNALEKPSSWTWASFKNNSRSDGLVLHHWVKGSRETVAASELPYKFEKYNTTLDIPQFTEEDYKNFIAEGDKEELDEDGDVQLTDEKEEMKEEKSEDNSQSKVEGDKEVEQNKVEEDNQQEKVEQEEKEEEAQEKEEEAVTKTKPIPWDYEETRYLFDLSKAFDLKWVVIQDRYNFNGHDRTIEELQERFYNVCQRILIYENENDETAQNSNLISNLNFSKKKEVERKAYLNRLLERTPAEIAEEESLLIEAKKFEVAAKKTITERSQLLQLLDSPQATGPISQYLTSQGLTQLYNQLMTEKRKRRVDSPAPENPLTALNEKIKQQHLLKQKQIQQEKLDQQKKKKDNPISILLSKNLTPREEEAFGLKVHQEKISSGVFLRSQKITSYKPAVQQRIIAILKELGIGEKPVLATEKVITKREELYKTINTLLELKKQVDKLESEARIVR